MTSTLHASSSLLSVPQAPDDPVAVPIRGGSVTVDRQDLDLLATHRWHVIPCGQVQCHVRDDSGRRRALYLARAVLRRMLDRDLLAGERAHTLDRDPTHCTRGNVVSSLTHCLVSRPVRREAER